MLCARARVWVLRWALCIYLTHTKSEKQNKYDRPTPIGNEYSAGPFFSVGPTKLSLLLPTRVYGRAMHGRRSIWSFGLFTLERPNSLWFMCAYIIKAIRMCHGKRNIRLFSVVQGYGGGRNSNFGSFFLLLHTCTHIPYLFNRRIIAQGHFPIDLQWIRNSLYKKYLRLNWASVSLLSFVYKLNVCYDGFISAARNSVGCDLGKKEWPKGSLLCSNFILSI